MKDEELTKGEFIKDCNEWIKRQSSYKFDYCVYERIERLIKDLDSAYNRIELLEDELFWSEKQGERDRLGGLS